jgi:DnaJ homolog subfamily C member 27|tara:strand:- start:1008 stop:1583 length:576 start_codon:yes stop_codon:yes gene_type:complete
MPRTAAANNMADDDRVDKSKLIRIKITSLGDGGTGKSCIIKRYCEEKFVSRYISTIGVDFGVKPMEINGYDVKVNFWDLSGHPEFYDVRNEFYKDTQGCLLVYDVTARRSFEQLEMWVQEATKFGVKDNTVWAVCANKCDKKNRAVTLREGLAWAEDHGVKHFETSAKSGSNVNEVFDYLFSTVVDNMTRR